MTEGTYNVGISLVVKMLFCALAFILGKRDSKSDTAYAAWVATESTHFISQMSYEAVTASCKVQKSSLQVTLLQAAKRMEHQVILPPQVQQAGLTELKAVASHNQME